MESICLNVVVVVVENGGLAVDEVVMVGLLVVGGEGLTTPQGTLKIIKAFFVPLDSCAFEMNKRPNSHLRHLNVKSLVVPPSKVEVVAGEYLDTFLAT